MNIFTFTPQHQGNLHSKLSKLQFLAKGKKFFIIAGLVALFCLVFSPVLAGEYTHAKAPAVPISLTSLSIQIGPGGFHLGIGVPLYSRAYAGPYVHVMPAPRPYWNPSRHGGNRHHHAAQKRGHGWENDGPRGNFSGDGGRGNGRHGGEAILNLRVFRPQIWYNKNPETEILGALSLTGFVLTPSKGSG